MDKRIHYADRLKGVAMLLVVMGHLCLFSIKSTDNMLFRFICTCQMPLFMFMSGFLITPPIRLNV